MKIVLIKEGGWGTVPQKSYEEQIESLKILIESLAERAKIVKKFESEIKVEVMDTYADFCKKYIGTSRCIVIFNSRSMISKAQELKKKHPKIKVFVLSGAISDVEAILLDKIWLSAEFLKTVLGLS